MTIYGFTGTRVGMSPRQKELLEELLKDVSVDGLHHGDCIGADAEAHDITYDDLGIPITIHPPDKTRSRAWKGMSGGITQPGVLILKPKPYLERNHDIVNACDMLIAAPREDSMIIRSGTWATVRYAREAGKPVIILA